MRYVPKYLEERAQRAVPNLSSCGNIDRSGSVTGMQNRFGWPKGGQVRIGSYIYNPGPAGIETLRQHGLLRGE